MDNHSTISCLTDNKRLDLQPSITRMKVKVRIDQRSRSPLVLLTSTVSLLSGWINYFKLFQNTQLIGANELSACLAL